jgi:uncharacterized protein (TIGR03032 family)
MAGPMGDALAGLMAGCIVRVHCPGALSDAIRPRHDGRPMPAPAPFRPVDVEIDVDRLAAEVAAFVSVAWRRDPSVPGRSFVALASRRGDHTDDRLGGVVRPTTWFEAGSYLAEVIGSLGVVVGRTRIVREPVGVAVVAHHPLWAEHDVIRISVDPVVPDGLVAECGDERRTVQPGSAWQFDGLHHVTIRSGDERSGDDGVVTWLEVVTVGRAAAVDGPSADGAAAEYERLPTSVVDPPGRVLTRSGRVAAFLPPTEAGHAARRSIDEFVERWRAAWSVRNGDPSGARFESARAGLRTAIDGLVGVDEPVEYVGSTIGDLVRTTLVYPSTHRVGPVTGTVSDVRFDRPVFVVGTPKSGLRRLRDALAGADGVVSLESSVRAMIGRVRVGAGWDRSDRIEPSLVGDRLAASLRDQVAADVVDVHGVAPPMNATGLRLVDADPRNALCIEMLATVFPDARFVFVTRDPRAEVAELHEVWRSGQPGRDVELPGWDGPPWTSVVPPGWQDWIGLDPLEIAAHQWAAVVEAVLADLDRVAPGRWTAVDHDVLVARPRRELRRILRVVGLDPTVDERRTAPLGRHRLVSSGRTLSDDQWAVVEPIVRDAVARSARVVDVRPDRRQAVRRVVPTPGVRATALVELLHQVDASMLVVGGDPGAVIVVGSDGEQLHFGELPLVGARAVAVPARNEIVVASTSDVWRYRKQRVARRSGTDGPTRESLFVARSSHHTGVIDAHEMAVDGDGRLWIVATRFSCLATLDDDSSFVPEWVPGFVSTLAADDRCHLNGLAMRDGRPRYVTAYSESDLGSGWRDTQTFGGVVVDVSSDEVIVRGMCMPHSPRWHDGALWVLESGTGSLGRIDLDAGRFERVVEVPGFARGLVMVGRYAVVATSGLRPTTVPGVPLADGERPSRVAVVVVDRDAGAIVGVLPMRARISEIHDLQLVAGGRLHLAEPGSEHHLHSVVVPPTKWADGTGS